MSLFDRDDDVLSSSSSSESVEESCEAKVDSAADVRARLGMRGRYTLTEADAKRAAEQRRTQALGQMSSRLGGASNAAGAGGGESGGAGSVFGSSIAAALQLRQEDKEQLLLRRIRAQREAEAGCAELVEKDLEVGVFVTPQYKEMLRKHTKRGGEAEANAATAKGKSSGGEGDDDDDLLDAYLRRVESSKQEGTASAEVTATSGSDSDFYDRAMSAAFQAPHRVTAEQAEAPAETSDGLRQVAPAPDLAELQHLVGLPPETPSAEALPAMDGKAEVAVAAATAAEEHQRVLFETREARKRARADATAIAACAARCEERILRCVRVS